MAIDTMVIAMLAIAAMSIDTCWQTDRVNWHYVDWQTGNCFCQLTLAIAMMAIDDTVAINIVN